LFFAFLGRFSQFWPVLGLFWPVLACFGLKYFFNQLADSPKIAKNTGFAIRGRPK
jgi:hypothetical protein